MKILIVDDDAKMRCGGIIEECNKRAIEFEIAATRRDAMIKVKRNNDFNGIILDMAFPISESSDFIDIKAGDRFLSELRRIKCDIPVLVFSKMEVFEIYSNLFARMKSWNEETERDKFYAFLEKLEKEQP